MGCYGSPDLMPKEENETIDTKNEFTFRLTTCKYCGEHIAKSAKVCPHCGGVQHKPIDKKKLACVILSIILAINTIGILYLVHKPTKTITKVVYVEDTESKQTDTTESQKSADTQTNYTETKDTTKDNTKSVQTENNGYALGETIKQNNVAVRVIEAEYFTDYEEWCKPTKGYEIYRCYLEIKNLSNDDIWVTYPSCYADDEYCELYIWEDNSFSWGEISANRKSVGWVYYEVPIGCDTIELEYETDALFNERIVIQVK